MSGQTAAFDAHCHLADPRFAEPDAVLARARTAGVSGVVVASSVPPNWRRQRALAARHPDVFVTYGIHPWSVDACAEEALTASLEELALELRSASPAPVAVGEMGLHGGPKVRAHARQLAVLRGQLQLARERDLPIVLHVVHAHEDLIGVLRADGVPRSGGMVHGFSGSPALAGRYLELGLDISLGTAVLDHRRGRLRETARLLPLERLLIESDAPDQVTPARRPSLNEPAFIVDVIEAVAELRGVSTEHVRAASATNARRLFRLALS